MATFEPSSWSQPVQDITKEYEAWDNEQTAAPEVQTAPEEVSKSMVRRGTLDPRTGMLTGNNKQSRILASNCQGYSEEGKQNYERIFGHA